MVQNPKFLPRLSRQREFQRNPHGAGGNRPGPARVLRGTEDPTGSQGIHTEQEGIPQGPGDPTGSTGSRRESLGTHRIHREQAGIPRDPHGAAGNRPRPCTCHGHGDTTEPHRLLPEHGQHGKLGFMDTDTALGNTGRDNRAAFLLLLESCVHK